MIQIVNFKPYQSGTLIGFCDAIVSKWFLSFKSISVFQKGESRWISLPQKKIEKDGKTYFNPLIEFVDKGVNQRFQKAVIDALVDAGHLSPLEPATAPKQNKKNPDRMTFQPNYRPPGDYPEITTENDGILY
jgi:hypothetical protein